MFSPQQPMRNYPQPGPPRPMPNQQMMGRRPPNMPRPSFGPQQQGFQQSGQFLPQTNAGARNGAGGGLKGMLSKFLPGGGGAGGAGAPGAGAAASGEQVCKAFKISPILHLYPACSGMCKKCSAWHSKSRP